MANNKNNKSAVSSTRNAHFQCFFASLFFARFSRICVSSRRNDHFWVNFFDFLAPFFQRSETCRNRKFASRARETPISIFRNSVFCCHTLWKLSSRRGETSVFAVYAVRACLEHIFCLFQNFAFRRGEMLTFGCSQLLFCMVLL